MRITLIVIRLVLAAMFVVAGAAKLRDRQGARQAVGDFGVPSVLVGFGAVALPLVELLVAVAIVFDPTSRLGAAGASVLLAVFIAAIVRVIRQGRVVACHCFGSVHSATVGPKTIMRNGVAAALAVYVAISPLARF